MLYSYSVAIIGVISPFWRNFRSGRGNFLAIGDVDDRYFLNFKDKNCHFESTLGPVIGPDSITRPPGPFRAPFRDSLSDHIGPIIDTFSYSLSGLEYIGPIMDTSPYSLSGQGPGPITRPLSTDLQFFQIKLVSHKTTYLTTDMSSRGQPKYWIIFISR